MEKAASLPPSSLFGRYCSTRVTVAPVHAGSIARGISPVIVPAAVRAIVSVIPSPVASIIPSPVATIGFMVSDGAADTGSEETMMSEDMPCDAADYRSLHASCRLSRTG